MPVVPRVSQPRVQRSGLPQVRVSPDAPSAAFQPKPPPIDFGAVTKVAENIFEQEQRRADEVAEVKYTSELAALQTNLLYGENGVLKREGETAFTAPEEVSEAWTKATSEIAKGLKTDRQRLAFNRQAMERWNSINGRTQEHVARERQSYDQKQVVSMVENEQNAAVSAYTDPEAVRQSIERQAAALNGYGKRHGFSADQIHAMVSKAVTDTHVSVIEAYAASDQDLSAKAYYEQHKDEIAGQVRPRIEQTLEEGSLRGESQRKSDELFAKYQDEGEALDAAAQIKEPKLRDEVERRIQARFIDKRRIDRERENDVFVSAANFIDAKPGVSARDAVPAHIWTTLKATQRRSLELYAQNGGGKGGGTHNSGDSNQSAWLDFLDLDEKEVKNLTRSELETRYLSKLGKRDAGRAITRWKNVREGKDAGGEDKREFSLIDDIKGSLYRSNVISGDKKTGMLTKKEKELINRVEDQVNRQRYEVHQRTGKKLAPADERLIVDQVVMRTFFEEGGTLLRAHNNGATVTLKRDRGAVRVDYDTIPAGRRKVLIEESKRLGGNASRSAIERAYAASLMNNESAVQAALRER